MPVFKIFCVVQSYSSSFGPILLSEMISLLVAIPGNWVANSNKCQLLRNALGVVKDRPSNPEAKNFRGSKLKKLYIISTKLANTVFHE